MQYAYFDPLTRRVLDWLDTVALECVMPVADMLIELTPEQWADNAHLERWVDQDLTLVALAPVLIAPRAQSIDAAWQGIKAERESRTLAGVNVGTHWVHSDVFSRSQWLGLKDNARDALDAGSTMDDVLRDDKGNPIIWKMLGGAFVQVTSQLAFDVVAAVTYSDMVIFAVAEQHSAAIREAHAPAAYDFTADWPQTYAEWLETVPEDPVLGDTSK